MNDKLTDAVRSVVNAVVEVADAAATEAYTEGFRDGYAAARQAFYSEQQPGVTVLPRSLKQIDTFTDYEEIATAVAALED